MVLLERAAKEIWGLLQSASGDTGFRSNCRPSCLYLVSMIT